MIKEYIENEIKKNILPSSFSNMTDEQKLLYCFHWLIHHVTLKEHKATDTVHTSLQYQNKQQGKILYDVFMRRKADNMELAFAFEHLCYLFQICPNCVQIVAITKENCSTPYFLNAYQKNDKYYFIDTYATIYDQNNYLYTYEDDYFLFPAELLGRMEKATAIQKIYKRKNTKLTSAQIPHILEEDNEML